MKKQITVSVSYLALFCINALLYSTSSYAGDIPSANDFSNTSSWPGYISILLFMLAYVAVVFEEQLHLRKSKPVLLAAGLIWVVIALFVPENSAGISAEHAIKHNFLEYSELFFFLLVAMTYINAMLERGVFDELRQKLVSKGYNYKQLFWITGFLAFFISPVADNLTTALIMCAVILAIGKDKPQFVAICCVNIVVAANAGGAFSPFGDITTLMVWQKGVVEFSTFFKLFIPSLISFLVPAIIMHFYIPAGRVTEDKNNTTQLKRGGVTIVVLFLLTIITAICFHAALHLPPVFGMLLGLSYLKFYGYHLKRAALIKPGQIDKTPAAELSCSENDFDVFKKVAHAEWDTLFFFYGVMLSVGGLGYIGYLALISDHIYGALGPSYANIMVGIISAIVDNIPVMFAVLTMEPNMPVFQWLLVTMTAGIGGSLLSIGSAAGVALMGQARGIYTFASHLRWTPLIALGYAAGIGAHFLING